MRRVPTQNETPYDAGPSYKEDERQEIEILTREFLDSGGEIEEIEPGIVTDSCEVVKNSYKQRAKRLWDRKVSGK